jgi:hypothetical protein
MTSPKQMGSDKVAPREGVTPQQQGSETQPMPRQGDKKPSEQMQSTQFTDWASI